MDNSKPSLQAPMTVHGEPETSAYEALTSLQDERQVLIFERYTKGEASVQAHVARPAHATLMDTMGAGRMTRRRLMTNVFADVDGYGWWGRPEQGAMMRKGGIQVTFLVTRFADDVARQKYMDLTGAHAQYCQAMEPGTLVYAGGIAVRDSDRGPDKTTGSGYLWAVR